jgi:hypothetical protein
MVEVIMPLTIGVTLHSNAEKCAFGSKYCTLYMPCFGASLETKHGECNLVLYPAIRLRILDRPSSVRAAITVMNYSMSIHPLAPTHEVTEPATASRNATGHKAQLSDGVSG